MNKGTQETPDLQLRADDQLAAGANNGVRSDVDNIWIYTETIESAVRGFTGATGSQLLDLIKKKKSQTIGHEIGHGINLSDHHLISTGRCIMESTPFLRYIMTRRHGLNLVLCIGCALLIITCNQEQPSDKNTDGQKQVGEAGAPLSLPQADGQEETPIQEEEAKGTTTQAPHGSDEPPEVDPVLKSFGFTYVKRLRRDGSFSWVLVAPVDQDKNERTRALNASLTEADWEGVDRNRSHPKVVEILVEGMDAFTAAKYLKARSGYRKYVIEYVDRAIAENPGNFEMLLFRAQNIDYEDKEGIEAAYRQLYQMKPDSIEVLAGLGQVLTSQEKPDEAIIYLHKVVTQDPSHSEAYMNLGMNYRSLRRWEEAVAAYEKAGKLDPGIKWITDASIKRTYQMRKETELREPVDTEIEDTFPSAPPSLEGAHFTPDTPAVLGRESEPTDKPLDFTLPGKNSEISAAEEDDKEVRRESEAFQNGRERSRKREYDED